MRFLIIFTLLFIVVLTESTETLRRTKFGQYRRNVSKHCKTEDGVKLRVGESRMGHDCSQQYCDTDFTIIHKMCPTYEIPGCKRAVTDPNKAFPGCCDLLCTDGLMKLL